MRNQEFATPQEALAHYGVPGMRWGHRKKDDSGSGKSGGAPLPELSKTDHAKVMDGFYKDKSPESLKAEGTKKLAEQAAKDFPVKGAAKQEKRDQKADKIDAQATKFDAQAKDLKAQIKDLPPGLKTAYKRANLKAQLDAVEQARDDLNKKSQQVRDGKLTDNQKLMIGVGAAVVVGGLAIYGHRQYTLNKYGITPAVKKDLFESNKRETSDQWTALFGKSHDFTQAGSHLTATSGFFYGGLTNKKALDRPEFTISKDTIFQRLSDHEEDSSSYISGAYSTFLKNDKKLYGASSEFGHKKFTVSFKPKEDVRVPTLGTMLAHLKQIERQSNPNVTDAQVYSAYHSMAGGNWGSPKAQNLFSSLRQHGYSAIVDDMDAGYLGDLPVVFFGAAEKATSTPRTQLDRLQDSIGVVKTTKLYA